MWACVVTNTSPGTIGPLVLLPSSLDLKVKIEKTRLKIYLYKFMSNTDT